MFQSSRKKRLDGDRVFTWANNALMVLLVFVFLYPFYYCVVHSFNDGNDALSGGILWLWPRMFTLENYRVVLFDSAVPSAFLVSALRTVLGTVLGVFFDAMIAFALTRRHLSCRKVYLFIGMVTIYFHGGIIPVYILMLNLGLINSFWVYVLPNLLGFYNIILMMAFMREIPASLYEAGVVDGASDFRIFLRIILPLSLPILATITLFVSVYHWNNWFDGYLYITNKNLKTLSLLLVEMINEALALEKMRTSGNSLMLAQMTGPTVNSVRLATMIVSIVPILCVYPFLQRFFVKGLMLGAVKG